MSDIDWFNKTVERVHSLSPDWRWFKVDCHNKPDGYMELVGAVPIGFIKCGPRKGLPKWPPVSACQTVWIRFGEVEETKRIWEKQTGQCANCEGTGETVWSTSFVAGKTERKMKPCVKCQGSGKAFKRCEP